MSESYPSPGENSVNPFDRWNIEDVNAAPASPDGRGVGVEDFGVAPAVGNNDSAESVDESSHDSYDPYDDDLLAPPVDYAKQPADITTDLEEARAEVERKIAEIDDRAPFIGISAAKREKDFILKEYERLAQESQPDESSGDISDY